MPKRYAQVRYVIVHRLDNGETVTAYKRGEPEWGLWDQVISWTTAMAAVRGKDSFGYTKHFQLYGPKSILRHHMIYTIIDDWVVEEKNWSSKAHDSMRVKMGWERWDTPDAET